MTTKRLSPEAEQRLADIMRARHADPAFSERMRAMVRQRHEWTDEQKSLCSDMAAKDATATQIAAAMNLTPRCVSLRARKYGIPLDHAAKRQAAGNAVLLAHYASNMPQAELYRLYLEARGDMVTVNAMYTAAKALKLKRPVEMKEDSRRNATKARAQQMQADRAALVQQVLPLLETHSLYQVAITLGVSYDRLLIMRREGLLPRVPTPKKVRAFKPPAPRRPQGSPRVLVQVPRFKAQSVEDFLAAGGQITRCPAAVLLPTSHKPSAEDAAAMSAYYAAKQAATRGSGRNAWQAARDAVFRRRAGA